MAKYQLGALRVEANYTDAKRALYQGNPWIEALPESPSDQELYALLRGSDCLYDEAERTLEAYERRDCIQSLSHVFIPLGIDAEVARKVFSAIREGYVSRNPLRGDWMHDLGDIQTCIRNRDAAFSSLSGTNANACGFCVVGDSGMGKTTAVNHALKLFPQVIVHRNYHGEEFPHMQLVWMRLECPQDASVKGLCSEFFMEFDKIFHDNTFSKFASGGRATVDQMIPQMAFVAQRHGLGLLVIDEIQNLSEAKSGGAQRMLNFIKQMVNTIGLPVLLVGTPPALNLLSTDLMTVRRSAGQQGISYLHPLKKESAMWKQFLTGIWKYQWTAEKTPLSDELADALYESSCGNLDITVKLYMESQRLTIMKNAKEGTKEIITPAIVRAAANTDSFKLVVASLRREQTKEKPTKTSSRKQSAPLQQAAVESKTSSLCAGSKANSTPSKIGASLLKELRDTGNMVKPEDEF